MAAREEDTAGYHLTIIRKGKFGEASKIIEEVEEFKDALSQGCSLMALVELSDLLGAIKGFLAKNHPSISIDDLLKMSSITQRVFENGYRD